jgi:hypothetical protein
MLMVMLLRRLVVFHPPFLRGTHSLVLVKVQSAS